MSLRPECDLLADSRVPNLVFGPGAKLPRCGQAPATYSSQRSWQIANQKGAAGPWGRPMCPQTKQWVNTHYFPTPRIFPTAGNRSTALHSSLAIACAYRDALRSSRQYCGAGGRDRGPAFAGVAGKTGSRHGKLHCELFIVTLCRVPRAPQSAGDHLTGSRPLSPPIPSGELSIDPEADERLGRVTGRAGAS
jgi:hypothetical protein